MESSTMKEAFEEIQRLSQDPKTRAIAISREIQLKDQMQREYDARMDGLEKGKEEGTAERERDIILNMYAKQMPMNTIAELTGIKLDKVQAIIEANLH